jgi:integrase
MRTITTAWRATCRRAGVSGLRFQDLRRQGAGRWLEVPGVTSADVRDLLGHTNITTTNTYLS